MSANDYILTLSCPDRIGIVHAVSAVLLKHQGNILDAQQFGDPMTNRFFLRVHFELPQGGMFTLKPKAGAWENYKIKEIQPTGVLLEYEVGLSHQSLGNDVLVKDTGDIFLKYR